VRLGVLLTLADFLAAAKLPSVLSSDRSDPARDGGCDPPPAAPAARDDGRLPVVPTVPDRYVELLRGCRNVSGPSLSLCESGVPTENDVLPIGVLRAVFSRTF
jgi:hypothetical protein